MNVPEELLLESKLHTFICPVLRWNIIFPEDLKMYPEVRGGNARTHLLSSTRRQMPFLDLTSAMRGREVRGGGVAW